jgi:putative ABC transport system permease protein
VPNDVRYAVRLLRRTPTCTTIAILILGLGIGVTTAVLAIVYGILIRPLPIADDRVVAIFRTSPPLQR